jgi:hypothetical protein
LCCESIFGPVLVLLRAQAGRCSVVRTHYDPNLLRRACGGH